MKSIRTLALVTGLLALSGVSQAQFSSTWTAVSDYDFRGFSQSAKDPALQGSADYAFGESGFAIGAWASNVDFGNDADMELDLYANYTASINDTFAITAGATYYTYPSSDDVGDFVEVYAGFNAGNFAFKQWYTNNLFDLDVDALYTEANYTQPIGDSFSLAFHVGYAWGDGWEAEELIDYALQGNWTVGNFTIFGKFTGTDASGLNEFTSDENNNEPRFLIGVSTTFPWGD
jgi:uncharacterized protein (TIGR02001 family)